MLITGPGAEGEDPARNEVRDAARPPDPAYQERTEGGQFPLLPAVTA
jgi:hypothetical protein